MEFDVWRCGLGYYNAKGPGMSFVWPSLGVSNTALVPALPYSTGTAAIPSGGGFQ